MIRSIAHLVSIVGLVALAAPAAADSIDTVLGHYQAVRLAMVDDRVDTEAAEKLASTVGALHEKFSAEAAGVAPDQAKTAHELLGEVDTGAAALVAAGSDLDQAREALYNLTKPLVRYRELMTGDKPAVAYCPMAKKSWLQTDTETIGNPYHGQSMPRCGSFVSE